MGDDETGDPFERTKTPLVVQYECGFREKLYHLVQTYSGDMTLHVTPNSRRTGRGRGSLLVSYEAPTDLSVKIMQLCGVSESSSAASQVVRVFFFNLLLEDK